MWDLITFAVCAINIKIASYVGHQDLVVPEQKVKYLFKFLL